MRMSICVSPINCAAVGFHFPEPLLELPEHPPNSVRLLRGEIALLAGVVGKIIEFGWLRFLCRQARDRDERTHGQRILLVFHVRLDERRRSCAVFVRNAQFVTEKPGPANHGPDQLPVAIAYSGVRADVRPVKVPLPESPRLHLKRLA